MSGEGQQESNNLAAAGFGSDEVSAWQAQKRQQLTGAGFNEAEVNDYFGQKTFNDQPLQDHFDKTIGAAAKEAQGDGTTPPKPFTMEDAFAAGWQNSTAGLMKRGKVPDLTLPENNTWYQRLAFNTTSMAGDLPAMAGGFLIGGGAGAETGPGAVITGTAGAFAMPAALRATMMDAYKKGEFHSASDFVSRAGGIMLDSAKGWVTGAAAATGGIAAKPLLAAAGAGALTTTTGVTAAEVGSMVTTAKALDGQLPEPKDFLDAAVTLAAFKSVPYIAGKAQDTMDAVRAHAAPVAESLRNIYAKTGKMPAEVVQDATSDPTIGQDILAKPGEVPTAYQGQIDPHFQQTAAPAPNNPAAAAGAGAPPTPPGATPPAAGGAPPSPPAGSFAAAKQNMLNKIEVGGADKAEPKNFDTLYTKVIDDMHPLQQAVKEMAAGQKVPAAEDPYILARLTRGAYGKADQFLTQSPYKFNDYANVGKSLKSIVEPFKENLDDLRVFAVAKRAQELEARGIKSGFDINDANAVVNGFGANMRPQLEAAVKDLHDYQDHLTKYLKDAGVLSDAAYTAMRQANQNYVPFYRVFDDERTTAGGAGKGIQTKDPIKAIKGSDRAVVDPIESIIKNTYAYLSLADRNEVGQKYISLAKATPKPEIFAKKVNPPIKGIEVQDKEMTAFLQSQGIQQVPADLLTVFRASRQPLADDEIAVFTKGKREVYQLPPEVAGVFKAADKETANWLFKIIASPTRMFRAGVTLSPDFMPRNLIRDQFDALINSRSGFVPLLDTVRGAASMMNQDEAYQNWLKSGGANATMVALDRDYIQNNVIKLNDETGFADHAWNVIKSPFDALRITSELFENATRLGEFKKATQEYSTLREDLANGSAYSRLADLLRDQSSFIDLNGNLKSTAAPTKAEIQAGGFESREVTLDFARIGSKTQAVNMLVAFWNAQLQGIDRLARRMKEDPLGTATKIGAAITVPSVLLWWNNHNDPRYKDIPDWQKDMFWIIMTKDNIYRIPKPHEAGILFASGVERFLDWSVGHDPRAGANYAANVLQSFAPGFVPTVAQPAFEQWANKSLFTGGSIIPASTEKLLPETQYQAYTTELSKALGKMVGTIPPLNKPGSVASPAIIENYIREWSGGLGMYTVQLADAGLRKTGVLPDPILPAATLADTPFVKAFVVRYPSAGAQPIQDFFNEYDSHKQVLDTVNYLAKQGDFNAAMRLAKMNPSAMVRLNGIKEGLTNAQRLVQLMTKNPSMSPNDKRQLIDSTYYQMINMARGGNDAMRQIDQVMGQ